MDWRNLLLLEHLLSVVRAKRRLFSRVSLFFALSLLAFYFLVPITYTTQPPSSSLFSWVSSLPSILNSSSSRPATQNSTTNAPGGSVFHLNLTCLGLGDLSFDGGFGSSSAGDKNESVVPKSCDIFDGRWVKDERKPYYAPGSCPYVGPDFNCIRNGRPDDGFMKWRWQPNGCDIPRLNATDFLERLRGKRLVFVGDSLNRNMWESLVCILRQSVADKKRVFEISGRRNFQGKGYYVFKFKDYDCSVEFVVSPFLVREINVKGPSGKVEQKLRLDLLDQETSKYRNANILVFNTGHWWNHHKTSKGENYYQEGNYLYPVLDVNKAFTKALTTWAKWVDKNINRNKTHVIFRGYSPMHFGGGEWDSGGKCDKETEPTFNQTVQREYNPKIRILHQVLKQMKTPVTYLNISHLTDYRKDGHPSIYRKKYKTVREKWAAERRYQDCSHWCLPGIPDTWNEVLYASMLFDGKGSWIN